MDEILQKLLLCACLHFIWSSVMSCDYKKELAFDYFSFSSPFFSIQFINSKMVLLYHDIIHQLLAFPPIVPPICYWTAQWPKCPNFVQKKKWNSAFKKYKYLHLKPHFLKHYFYHYLPKYDFYWWTESYFAYFIRVIYGQHFKVPAIVHTLKR